MASPKKKPIKQNSIKEWFSDLSTFWKTIIIGISSLTLVIGTYQKVQSSIATKAEVKCLDATHNKDVAEISSSFQRYQIRQEIRETDKDINKLELEKKRNMEKEIELKRLKLQKEELMRDLDEIKNEQRKQIKQQKGE
jgi:hypothetical protein